MRLGNLSRYTKIVGKALTRKSPTILTGAAVAGTIGSVVLTHFATKKAVRHMEEVRTGEDYVEPETVAEAIFEEVKETWKYYTPVAGLVVVTVIAEVQSNRINLRRIAAVTDAYRISENLRKEYQDKVKEVLGENKESKIQQSIVQDRVNADPPGGDDSIIITGKGNSLCKDWWSGRYFYCDPEYLRRVRNKLDSLLLANDYLSLNELYYEIPGLEPLPEGDAYGWNLERCDRRDLTDIDVVASMAPDGRPILVLKYEVELGYDRYEPS